MTSPADTAADSLKASWFVYIVRCADGSLYTGMTNDVPRRCEQHNAGRGARYTRARRPVHLLHSELCSTRSEALRREAAIKALSRRQKEDLIDAHREKRAG